MSGTTNDSKTPEIKCCFELINAFPEKQDDLLADLSSVLANPLTVVPIENGFMCELSKTADRYNVLSLRQIPFVDF